MHGSSYPTWDSKRILSQSSFSRIPCLEQTVVRGPGSQVFQCQSKDIQRQRCSNVNLKTFKGTGDAFSACSIWLGARVQRNPRGTSYQWQKKTWPSEVEPKRETKWQSVFLNKSFSWCHVWGWNPAAIYKNFLIVAHLQHCGYLLLSLLN